MKKYLFDWIATYPNKLKTGKITVTADYLSAAQIEAIQRVKDEWNYHDYNVSVDLTGSEPA